MFNNIYKSTVIVAGFFIIFSCATLAQADTIILTNGDTLTGSISAQNDKEITLNSPILGELKIAKDKVKSIQIEEETKAEKKKEEQKAAAKEAKQKESKKESKPEKTSSKSNKAKQSTPELDKNKGFFDSEFFQGWKTQISLGFSGSSGNTRSKSMNAEFKTRKKTEDFRWIFDSKYFYGSESGETSENQFSAKITHDWLNPDSNWLLFGNAQYEYDQFKNWKSRVSGYVGAGYTFIDTSELSVTARLGFGGTQHLGGDKKFTPEAMLGATAAHWKITDNQTVNLSNTIYPALDDSGQFRNITEANWTMKIDQDDGLSLKIGIQNEYDSHVAKGDKRNNFKYYGALVYDF